MKKILSLLMMALMAISANAQEVCVFNPDNSLGLDADNGTDLLAGTVIGETDNIIATIGAADTYKPQSYTFTAIGVSITGGLVGNTNPKDEDGGWPSVSLYAPTSGTFLVFEAKADGWLYVMHMASSHKAYSVFEEGTAIGYTFAAIGDASTDLGDVYQFTLVGEGEYNEIKNPIEWAEREFLKNSNPEKYAAYTSNDTKIAKLGLGVIKFPVFKDCKYIVNANGSKIKAAGYVFSKEENVTITSNDVTIIGDGVKLCFNYITKGKIAEVISNPNGKYIGNIIIPATVTHEGEEYTVNKIADYAFSGCTGLTSITIPNSLTSIGGYAFRGCSGLSSFTIPNSVTSIGSGVFEGCTGFTSFTIPSNMKSISNGLFAGCIGLTSVPIPSGVESIGDDAFEGCTSLASIDIPNSVTYIHNGAFSSCRNLKSVDFKKVSSISLGDGAFRNCDGLTTVDLYNVGSIGECCFENCTGLTSITIPENLYTLREKAFTGCSNLKT